MRRLPGLNVAHLQRWTSAEVGRWLQIVGLGRFAALFEEHNIGGDVLLDVTTEDLVDMGLRCVGDRRRILRALEVLGQQSQAREGPQLDVAVLGASPLVRVVRGVAAPLEPIDLLREQDRLCAVLRAGTHDSARAFDTGTFEALSRVLQVGAMVLVLTAHATGDGKLLLERQTGEAFEFDPSTTLREMAGAGTLPVCVVLSLSGPGLGEVARALLRHGARHVVTLSRAPEELDTVASTFNAVLLRGLLCGSTVADAFAFAVSAVHHGAEPKLQPPQSQLSQAPPPRRQHPPFSEQQREGVEPSHSALLPPPGESAARQSAAGQTGLALGRSTLDSCGTEGNTGDGERDGAAATGVAANGGGEQDVGRQVCGVPQPAPRRAPQSAPQRCAEEGSRPDTWTKFALHPDDVPGRHDVALFPPPALGFAPAAVVSSVAAGECEGNEDGGRSSERSSAANSSVGPVCEEETWAPARAWEAARTEGATDEAAFRGVEDLQGCCLGDGSIAQISPRLERTVGRQTDIWRVVLALGKSRCVVICGVGGVGKAALCRSVASYLVQRKRRFCEHGLHTVCLRGVRTVHAARSQLRHAIDDVGVTAGPNGPSTPGASAATGRGAVGEEESLEAVVARCGERLLVLESAEELFHYDAGGLAEFLDRLFVAGPRLRVLLTSRRTLPAGTWPTRNPHLPFHVYLRQLEPRASVQLLLDLVPAMRHEPREFAGRIAVICGHLPLALKLVGQRLAATESPIAEARVFIAETESPEKRASMLFSECVAPYVWRSLDAGRQAALAALSLFRAAFEASAAAAVLGVPPDRAHTLLREFHEQCLVERPSEGSYYMPTSVHLLVHQQIASAGVESCGTPAEHASAAERLVLHFARLIRDVARATASDRGRGGAGLEDLRAFDRHRVDVDLALVLAGTSDLFVLMAQLGRDVFDTRLSAQRRIEIYERLLGILMAARKAAHASPSNPSAGAGIVKLLRQFQRHAPDVEGRPGQGKHQGLPPRSGDGSDFHKGARRRVFPPTGAPRTQPTTPVARCWALQEECEDDNVGSPMFISKSLPASPQAAMPSASEFIAGARFAPAALAARPAPFAMAGCVAEPMDAGLGLERLAAQASPKSESGSTKSQGGATKGGATNRLLLPFEAPPPRGRTMPGSPARHQSDPSYRFVELDDEEDAGADECRYEGSDSVGSNVCGTSSCGIMAFKPAWCPVLTAGDNERLRGSLEEVVRGLPRGGGHTPGAAGSGSSSSRAIAEDAGLRIPACLQRGGGGPAHPAVGARFAAGGAASDEVTSLAQAGSMIWWHEEKAHDLALVEVLLRLGAAHSALGRFAHAAQLLRKALIRAEHLAQRSGTICGLSAEAMRAELLGTLSGVLCQQGLCQEAEAMLWQARQLAKHAGHAELYIKLTCDLAEFNRGRGNFNKAERLFRLGLNMRMKTLELENIDTASTLNAVGVFLAQKGDFDEAKKMITDAIKIRIKLLGRMHLSVAEAYHNLGTVHDSLHNHEDAVQLFEAALQVKRGTLPENHMSIADTKNQLSALYSKMKKHDECIHLLRGCLSQCLATVGEEHASTASVMVNLGRALHTSASDARDAGQLDESQAVLQSALALAMTLFRKRHPLVAECRGNLGYVYFKKNEFVKAERHFRAALRISRNNYGRLHPDVAVWSSWLGKTQLEMRYYGKGRDNLKAAIGVVESLLDRCTKGGASPLVAAQLAELRSLLSGARTPVSSPTGAMNLTVGASCDVATAGAGVAEEPHLRGVGQEELVELSEPAAEPSSSELSRGDAEGTSSGKALLQNRPRPPCLASPEESKQASPSPSDSDGVPVASGGGEVGALTSAGCTRLAPRASPTGAPGRQARTSPKSASTRPSPTGASAHSFRMRSPKSVPAAKSAATAAAAAVMTESITLPMMLQRSPKALGMGFAAAGRPSLGASQCSSSTAPQAGFFQRSSLSLVAAPATVYPASPTTSSSSDSDDEDGPDSSSRTSQYEADVGDARPPSRASYAWIMRYVRKSAAEYQSGRR